jgi:hypothetical protein
MSELDKMLQVKEKSQVIRVFLKWLKETGYDICKFKPVNDVYGWYSIGDGMEEFSREEITEKLLAEFFDINLKKAEEEKNF